MTQTRSFEEKGRWRRRLLAGLFAVVVASLSAGGALAQNMVYHSPNDDGVNPGTAVDLPIGPSEPLFLYLDVGSDPTAIGIPCSDGDGRELCGYEVIVDAIGGASFVDFIPDQNVVHLLTPSQLNANGLFALNPSLGPIRIGELRVASSGPGSEVMIMGGEAVLSGLQIETIAMSVVANTPVPEPGLGVGVLLGAFALTAVAGGRTTKRTS